MLCLLHYDSMNISAAVLGKSLGVTKILAFVRKPSYEAAYKASNVDIIVKMSDLIFNKIIMEIEQPPVKEIVHLGVGKVEIYSLIVSNRSKSLNMKIKDIALSPKFPKKCIIIGIYRDKDDEFHIPRGDHILKENDELFFVTHSEHLKQLTKILL